MSYSLLHEVSQIAQFINLDRIRTDNGDLSHDYYMACHSTSEIPDEYQSEIHHIFDMGYSRGLQRHNISIYGYNEEELGFILKLVVSNCCIIPKKS